MEMLKSLSITFLKGLAAGALIGCGGVLYTLWVWAFDKVSSTVGEPGKILGSIFFSVGLLLICIFRLSLYTGKIGLIFECKQSKEFYLSLPVMAVANLAAALCFGLLISAIFQGTGFITIINRICSSRIVFETADAYIRCIFSSALCGSCVYLAVKSYGIHQFGFRGVVLVVFFIAMFVYSGFQHCIANTFYFGCGRLSSKYVFINVIICIFGNMLGTAPLTLLFKKDPEPESCSSEDYNTTPNP